MSTRTLSLATCLVLALAAPALTQGPCCAPSSSPGCADAACTGAVCTVDPFCCAIAWDERCAVEASVLCAACRPATTCAPPDADLLAPEGCGTSSDDPCAPVTQACVPLPLGMVIEGTAWAGDAARDVDWFEITLAEPAELEVTCWSEGPMAAAIVDAACPPTVFAEAVDGCPGRCSACLPAGTWRVAVRSLLFEPIACGEPRARYRLRATATPCAPSTPANDRCDAAQAIVEGAVAFDTRSASSEPAWLPATCDEGAGLAFTHDVWFRFTAGTDGVHRFGTCETLDFDARLSLHEACGGPVLACSDDACAGGAAQVEAGLACGQTVWIRVGGWGHGAVGTLLAEAVQPDGCACLGDFDASGEIDSSDIGILLLEFGTFGGPADLDRDLEVGSGDLGLALLLLGPCG